MIWLYILWIWLCGMICGAVVGYAFGRYQARDFLSWCRSNQFHAGAVAMHDAMLGKVNGLTLATRAELETSGDEDAYAHWEGGVCCGVDRCYEALRRLPIPERPK